MDKIIRAALSAKFGTELDGIMEVVNWSPNTKHAVELLLGIYEEPKFKTTGKYTYNYKGEAFKDLDAKFISYNPWEDNIVVSVTVPKEISIKVLPEHYDIVNSDNYKEYEHSEEEWKNTDTYSFKTVRNGEMIEKREIISGYDGYVEWYDNTEC